MRRIKLVTQRAGRRAAGRKAAGVTEESPGKTRGRTGGQPALTLPKTYIEKNIGFQNGTFESSLLPPPPPSSLKDRSVSQQRSSIPARRETVQPNTSDKQFSEEVLKQVLADARRALTRGHFSAQATSLELVRCIEHQPETDRLYGSQLWFFDATAADENNKRKKVFGVIEYSIQYGMYELVEDGVFESIEQRYRYRSGYRGILPQPRWRDPAHKWLLAAVLAVSAATLAYYTLRLLAR